MLMYNGRSTMPRADYLSHGEAKKQKQLLLTETAVKLIDQAAQELGISRSEAVERAARGGKFREAVQAYDEIQVRKE